MGNLVRTQSNSVVSGLCLSYRYEAAPSIYTNEAILPDPPFTDAWAAVLQTMSAVPCLSYSCMYLRSKLGHGRFRSYLLPPGAVGGLYGSGCFHFSNRSSVCLISSCVSFSAFCSDHRLHFAYSLLSWLCDVSVRFEEPAEVERLATPDVSVNCPVECELQRTAIEGAERCQKWT